MTLHEMSVESDDILLFPTTLAPVVANAPATDLSKLPACASCKLRRVKCIRTDPLLPCDQCLRKGIACALPEKQARKPYKDREGTRIKQAKEKYGAQSSQELMPAHGQVISFQSANDKVAQVEELDSFLASLVDSYYESISFQVPIAKWNQLRVQFDQAGRRANQMKDTTTELLIRCSVAYGALISDCPSLIGERAPTLKNLSKARGVDLSVYGQRRQAIAKMLFDQAVTLVDARGVFRNQSMESVSTLMCYSELQTYANGGVSKQALNPATPYLNASVNMIKDRHAENPDFNFFSEDRGLYKGVGSSLSGWTTAIIEAISSTLKGSDSQIRDRELHIFIGPLEELEGKTAITVDDIQRIVFSEDESEIAYPVRLLWYNLIKLVRKIGTNISTVISFEDRFPLRDFHVAMDEYEQYFQWIALSTLATQESPFTSVMVARQQQTRQIDFTMHLKTAPMIAYSVMAILEHQLTRFQQRRAKSRIHALEDETRLAEQIASVKRRMDAHMLTAARSVAAHVAGRPLIEAVYFHSSVGFLGDHIFMWAKTLITAPCDYEGGPPDFTFQDKVRDVSILIDSIRIQSWSWPSRAADAAELEALLQGCKQAYNARQQASGLWNPSVADLANFIDGSPLQVSIADFANPLFLSNSQPTIDPFIDPLFTNHQTPIDYSQSSSSSSAAFSPPVLNANFPPSLSDQSLPIFSDVTEDERLKQSQAFFDELFPQSL